MFGRGNWAILGLNKDSLDGFKANLEEQRLMLAVSQCAASAITRHIKIDSIGINPFSAPRLDEQGTIDLELEGELARYAASDAEARSNTVLPETLVALENFAYGAASFEMHSSLPWYGLWAVSNEWKDVSDLASIKEQHSYAALERPYKFLKAIDKRSVDQEIRGLTAAMRKQFPVLLDFHGGRLYVENSGKKTLHTLKMLLKQLGLEIFPVAWDFNRSNWPAAILDKLRTDTQYGSDFEKRAEEATRFRPKEIEKLEDREVESVVANFFSMTQLGNELWAGLSTPAQIRLHATSAPVAAKAVTSATTLLGVTEEAHLLSGSLTFQERITFSNKKGEEQTFRKDVLSLDVNDQINLTDAGAAMLRGFDIPAFRKDIQREIKQSKQVPSIEEFWSTWLHQMSNAVRTIEESFREILGVNGDEKAGIVPMQVSSSEELVALEVGVMPTDTGAQTPLPTPEVGAPVLTHSADLPQRISLTGRWAAMVPLDADKHSAELWEVLAGEENKHIWAYLQEGPFPDFAGFYAYVVRKVQSQDPLHYAIVDTVTAKAAGMAALMRIEPADRVIEVGSIVFSPRLQRTRSATEAMYLLARYVFEELGYRRYEWKCNALNEASRRAAQRLGFTFEGIFRQHKMVKGRNRDTAWFSMLDKEWPARRQAFEAWLDPRNFDASGQQRSRLNQSISLTQDAADRRSANEE